MDFDYTCFFIELIFGISDGKRVKRGFLFDTLKTMRKFVLIIWGTLTSFVCTTVH